MWKYLSLKELVKLIIFPLTIIFVSFPNLVRHLLFLFFKKKIPILKMNCVFLLNPKSGLNFGDQLLNILNEMYPKERVINLLEDNALSLFQNQIEKLNNDEYLYVVICGGDGTVSTMIDKIEKNADWLRKCVFVPMPLGTGNDLSIILNHGSGVAIDDLYLYFNRLNSSKTKIANIDLWNVTYTNHQNGQVVHRKMLLYFGIGYDGRITRIWNRYRLNYKFMFMNGVG